MFAERTRERILSLIGFARPVFGFRTWPVLCLILGTAPLLAGYWLGTNLHQLLIGLLLAPLFWACILEDRLRRAVLVVVLVMGSHSALAIYLSAHDAPGAARALSGAQDYWLETLRWIHTGSDPEYDPAVWLPRHLILYVLMLLGGSITLGIVPFARGVEQVDLMNFYVGRLVAEGDAPWIAILLGWHPWSILRGSAYTILVFVAGSWALERLSGRAMTLPGRHRQRLILGTALAISDGLAKLLLAPWIRDRLLAILPG